VVAPRTYCFPGGAIEPGESESQALRREFDEELNAEVLPRQRLWRSMTPWNVRLSWWLAELDPAARLSPNPHEVETYHWLTVPEIRRLPELLTSNHAFLAAWERGEFSLPVRRSQDEPGSPRTR
jgi:8-oxo-dGTP pyrophosphatase MutT (NUDIX family)